MARSDFRWINFDEQFNAGNTDATRTFNVEGQPRSGSGDTGYILIQALDVERNDHQILINGRSLPGFDIPEHGNQQWFTWMDRIPPGFLNQGSNRLTIRRVGNEDFSIANAVVHWREND